jgi:hypothetical protein
MKIWDILKANFKSQKPKKTIINSIVYNTLYEVFLEKKWIDIRIYIVSTDFNEGRLRIKTSKPIISEEILSIETILEEKILWKLAWLGENYKKISIYAV